MKKKTPKPDENQTAFNGLQELLRRDEERGATIKKQAHTGNEPRKPEKIADTAVN